MLQNPAGEGKRFGPYTILGEIARGGQGVVLRARRDDGRDAALKLLLDPSPTRKKRFIQEARVLARLSHPNLLRVADHGEHKGMAFMAMEFVEGEDLADRVAREGRLDPELAVRVLGDVATALEYCHGQGLVHRDIKPANILIEKGTERTVLVDFGMVKRDPEQMKLSSLDDATRFSKTGELKGTPAFMAPEQVSPGKFGEVSPRTDVYALGATLHFLLTGETPFDGDSLASLLAQVLATDPPDARRLGAPPRLARLASASMSKAPAARPASAAAFAAALRGEEADAGGTRGRTSLLIGSAALNLALALGLGLVLAGRAPPEPSWPASLRLAKGGALELAEIDALERSAAGSEWARWLPYLRVERAVRAGAPEALSLARDLPEGPERALLVAEALSRGTGLAALEEASQLLEEGAKAELPWRGESAGERWASFARVCQVAGRRAAEAPGDLLALASVAWIAAAQGAADDVALARVQQAFALDPYAASRAGAPIAPLLLRAAAERLRGPSEVARAPGYQQASELLIAYRHILPAAPIPEGVLGDLRRHGTGPVPVRTAAMFGSGGWPSRFEELFPLLETPLSPDEQQRFGEDAKAWPRAWKLWIVDRARAQDHAGRRAMFREWLLWRPELSILWIELGATERITGRWGWARRAFEISLELAPTAKIRQRLGLVLVESGRLKEGISVLRQAFEESRTVRGDLRGWTALSLANAYLLNDQAAEALGTLDEIRTTGMTGLSSYWRLRLQALVALGRDEEAIVARGELRGRLGERDR